MHINKEMQKLQDQIDLLINQQSPNLTAREMRTLANKIGALQCKLERLINSKKEKKTIVLHVNTPLFH